MKIIVFGDFSGYTKQFSDYFDNNGSSDLFGDLVPILKEHCLNVYHQEFPLTSSDKRYAAKLSGPFIKCNPKAAACLGKAVFHVATFASNHTLNYGETGLYDTIDNLTRVGIDVIGAGNTKEKAKEPYFYEKDGIKICILNYAETQFNLATGDHGGANPLDIIDNVGDIKRCKELVDHVIVIIHGGPDFCPYPSPRMVKQYRFYIDSGASAVINHHQHVVAGYEAYNGKPIFYGIGSVVPGKIIVPGCKEGLGISLNIQKDNIASEIIESIKNDPHYSKINFIPIGNKKRICDNNKIWNYVYRLFLQYSLKFKIKAHLCGEEERALFSVGDSFIHLSILSDICKRNDILLFHERTEYPLLNIVSLPQKVNMFMYLNIFVPRCDHIFVISTALRDFFVMHLQKQSKDIQVSILNMIVEPDRYAQVTNTSYGDTKDIVYVGTPYGSKDGVYDLVEAFSLIMNDFPNARLIIVGDTSRPERMKKTLRLIDNLPDKDRVLLTGQLGREQVVKIINNAYCLTLARPANIQAKYGFPTKLGEYLATGRPVVITRVGDIPIYLKDGDNAFVAEPDNVYSFAERLAKCLNDSVNSQKIGEAGKYLIYKEFNYKSESNKILKSFSR